MSVPTVDYENKKQKQLHPDEYRMTIGEHLEELRWRLILGLGGFAVAAVVCLIWGKEVVQIFCKPLLEVLREASVNPQVYFTQMTDPFMVYIKISLISAAVLASPWLIYQMWLFVAAGLYSHERKFITRYVPLSITLLISGVLFVYFFVLPWTLQFFMLFALEIKLPTENTATTQPTTAPTIAEILQGDPIKPVDGELWFNELDGRLKFFHNGKLRVLQFGSENLTSPIITLPDYVDMVLGMLLTFGLSFQLPLVVIALVSVGILERESLKKGRRYVYFALAVVAAAITPGDVITATVALMVPLIGLYELGIWLSRPPKEAARSRG
jgi:sec-independent protein translocase protein TatC